MWICWSGSAPRFDLLGEIVRRGWGNIDDEDTHSSELWAIPRNLLHYNTEPEIRGEKNIAERRKEIVFLIRILASNENSGIEFKWCIRFLGWAQAL